MCLGGCAGGGGGVQGSRCHTWLSVLTQSRLEFPVADGRAGL